MTGRARFERFFNRRGFLRDAGERIEFTQDADNWLSLTVGCDERGWHSGDAALDFEALLLGVIGKRFGGFVLAQRCFRKGPDLVAQLGQLGFVFFN